MRDWMKAIRDLGLEMVTERDIDDTDIRTDQVECRGSAIRAISVCASHHFRAIVMIARNSQNAGWYAISSESVC